jgi:hypothetical protein
MRTLRVLAWVWVGVLALTGLGGGVIIDRVGWALAEGLTIYTGNTEPVHVELPYPWGLYALCVIVAAAGLGWGVQGRRAHRGSPEPPSAPPTPAAWLRSVGPITLAYAGGVCAALLPFIQLYRLFSAVQAAAGAPMP